nr:MAG TPA: hypothetical protein [Caudoviricetes sp.]
MDNNKLEELANAIELYLLLGEEVNTRSVMKPEKNIYPISNIEDSIELREKLLDYIDDIIRSDGYFK